MILTKNIKIKVNSTAVSYYKNLGYDIKIFQEIEIPIEHLSTGSKYKIDALCDYCKEPYLIAYRWYNHSIKTNGKFCCKRCTPIKTEENNIKKYGVKNVYQLEENKEKVKKTKA